MENSIDEIMTQFKQIEGENSDGAEKSVFSLFPTFSTKNSIRILFLLFILFIWCTILLFIFRPNIITDTDNKIVWKYLFLYNLLLFVSLLFVTGIGVYIAFRFIK